MNDLVTLCACGYVHAIDPVCMRTHHRYWCAWILSDRDGVEREPCDCGQSEVTQ